MSALSRIVRVHEQTVQAVAPDVDASAGWRRHRSGPRTRRTIGQRTISVDKRVWGTALDLASGELHRIEIVSATEVLLR